MRGIDNTTEGKLKNINPTVVNCNQTYWTRESELKYTVVNGICFVTGEITPISIPSAYVQGSVCSGLPAPKIDFKITIPGFNSAHYPCHLDGSGYLGFYFANENSVKERADFTFSYPVA